MQPTSRGVYYITNDKKCYASAHFRYLLTTFVLIRNILIAFTTSCVSIFDISNDILYTSSFSHHSFTSSTANNADFRFIQILHVPLYFIGQKFSHEQIHTDCFSQNVLLDLLHLQRQLCISRPFGTWFLYSKKSPLFTFFMERFGAR